MNESRKKSKAKHREKVLNDPVKLKKLRDYEYEYRNRPEVIAHRKDYRSRPEVIERTRLNELQPHRVENNKEYLKEYYQRDYVRENRRNKDRKRTPVQKLRYSLGSLLREALKDYTKEGKVWSSSKYGVNYDAIIKHLEKQATTMGFKIEDLRGQDYHIDHIIPVSMYNFKLKSEIKNCFHHLNLRWLPAKENISKGNRLRPQDLEIIKTLPKEIYPQSLKGVV